MVKLKFKPGPQIKGVNFGDVVLIEGEGPKLNWPLCIVKEMHPGKDGIARAATVKTAKGTISRPIQRLRFLEISAVDAQSLLSAPSISIQDPAPDNTVCPLSPPSVPQARAPDGEAPVVSTGSGRVLKKRQILDL